MTITRTVSIDGTEFTLTVRLTDEELRTAHQEYQRQLDAEADFLSVMTGDLLSAFMQNLLAAGVCDTEEEAGEIARTYIHDKYAADFALNEEEPTND